MYAQPGGGQGMRREERTGNLAWQPPLKAKLSFTDGACKSNPVTLDVFCLLVGEMLLDPLPAGTCSGARQGGWKAGRYGEINRAVTDGDVHIVL